jgi:dihydrofolate reductase
MLNAILAVDRDGAIGWSDGRLPWKLPDDLKRLKELTTGNTVVMGYNTFKSLNRPRGLPNRQNVVLTSRDELEFEADISIIRSLDDLTQIESYDVLSGRTTWIIGGAQLYNSCIDQDLLDHIYLTLVDVSSGADVRLSHEFNYWEHFILHEQEAYGRNWYVGDIDPRPTHTYLILTRRRDSLT